MIKKLKMKFILLSMSALLCLLVMIVAGMNIINYHSVIKEADNVLSILSQNKGKPTDIDQKKGGMGRPMSPKAPFETRYFSVLLDNSGNVVNMELNQMISISKEDAVSYGEKAFANHAGHGFTDSFRYARYYEESKIRIAFLDCGRELNTFYDFLFISLGMSLTGYLAVLVVVIFFAGKIIRPIAESYEKQKRFITDAGHEIKTPLTIINANADLLKMELGENECLIDIQIQVERLTTLTKDLVYLARMEERETSLPMIEFPISDVISETVFSFKTLAQTQRKELDLSIEPMLSMNGDAKSIEQMISILMDNAIKYSPEGSKIAFSFKKNGRHLILSVINKTAAPIQEEALSHVFERFFRSDSSRNFETGGHGIGLSMAQAITAAHGGKIHAWTDDGSCFGITVTFPL